MTTWKSLPARPSLESLRTQANELAREIEGGDAGAVERARLRLPDVALPLTESNAQLVIAQEYGFTDWQHLTAEVSRRLGSGLEWAAAQARRLIHDKELEELRQLLAENPGLLSWHDENGGSVLGFATESYGDSFDTISEEHFTRAACAELLIDRGAVVMPSVVEGALRSRARGLLQLFRRKDLLPRTLKFNAALGDIDAVSGAIEQNGNDLGSISEAFTVACGFEHEAVASVLLDRAIALDPELGIHIEGSVGRPAFIESFIHNRPRHATEVGLWKAFVMEQVRRAVSSWSGHSASVTPPIGNSDLEAFIRLLRRESWLLGDGFVAFQADILALATLKDRGAFITALLDLDPAILRRQPPPQSQAIEFAFTYARTHLVPLLTRIWPLPDDLPHAAGRGDLARVQGWFESGKPALGDIERHYPSSPYMPRERVQEYADQWGAQSVQRVLDTAFAWAVMNSHFDVADFLLGHGADINTTWSSHEPASILHELVWHQNYEAMQFLVERGIDMTIRDYRWDSTAQGWARHAAKDEKMARWLEDAERQQRKGRIAPQ
jgi:hypothetical protein